MMKKKNWSKLIKRVAIVILLLCLVLFTSCKNNNKEDSNVYNVCFVYYNNEKLMSKTNSDGYVIMPKTPTKEHAEFLGWYLGEEEFDFSMPIESDVTLVARFLIDSEYANLYKVTFYNDEEIFKTYNVLEDRLVGNVPNPKKEGFEFVKWVIDDTGEDFLFGVPITSDVNIKAFYKAKELKVTFNVEGENKVETVNYGETVSKPIDPEIDNLIFVNWMYFGEPFDFNSPIYEDIELIAKFKHNIKPYTITYDFGYECYQTKNDLMVAFYTTFYNFLAEKEVVELEQNNIKSVDEFIIFMTTWCVDPTGARKDLYHTGDAFGKYYITKDVDGVIENQPVDTFVGYCYQNNMYRDLLNHLVIFFAYWRTDEGYTTSTNHGNDFFYDGWASLVDTAKFFYFTDANLSTKYSWFKSQRVRYALDHIPGVGRVSLIYALDDYYTLPTDITREGYEFVGWFDKDGNSVTETRSDISVYARWKKIGE